MESIVNIPYSNMETGSREGTIISRRIGNTPTTGKR